MTKQELLLIGKARRLARSGEGRSMRLRADLSLREVADAIGLSPSALWRWERGERQPRGPAAAAWARLLEELSRPAVAS